MRWWARRQSGPSLFFFTTWETRTTTSSALLCCTHMYMYKHRQQTIFVIMFIVYFWPFAVPGWRTVRSRWRRSLPGSSVSWVVSNRSSPSSVTPTQSPLLRSSATNSALHQSMLGTLFCPSGRLLSNPSCHCSDSKRRVVLNKVFSFFVCSFSSIFTTCRKPKRYLVQYSSHCCDYYVLFSSVKIIFIQVLIYFPFLAFLEALPHLCQHVNLVGGDGDSRAVLCALIGLMEDPDPVVRICFSQSVRFLLPETTRNSEQGSLSEVSNSSGWTQTSVLYTHLKAIIIIITVLLKDKNSIKYTEQTCIFMFYILFPWKVEQFYIFTCFINVIELTWPFGDYYS